MAFTASRVSVPQVSRNKSRNNSRFRSLRAVTDEQLVRTIREYTPQVPPGILQLHPKPGRGRPPADPFGWFYWGTLPVLHLAAVTLMRRARRSNRGLLTLRRWLPSGISLPTTPAQLVEALRGIPAGEDAYDKHMREYRRHCRPVKVRLYDFRSGKLVPVPPNPRPLPPDIAAMLLRSQNAPPAARLVSTILGFLKQPKPAE